MYTSAYLTMNTQLIIILLLLAAGAVYLIFYLRALMRRSEEQWKAVDKDKLREWEDDDD